ncbi:hypothetical protein BACCELL_01898 [Bacteroides cellulosilyticus DSM 14838]|uniref:Uncharacterized protein n=1 Tax=Bacteroides cellulosilyticus DSM 14838 TaxID=537012 RepID=E2NC91_9BACE|nr:hypothetical protein BACCELL_01898 [Bacteroides cellulosilyticus DSM 14838]
MAEFIAHHFIPFIFRFEFLQPIATLLFAFPYTTTKSLSSNKCIFDAVKVYK